jgi:transposase-like protein
MIGCKGSHFEKDIMLWGVRWYVANPLSSRQLEESQARGGAVDHATLNREVLTYAPEVELPFRRRQQPVGRSWRMDDTSVLGNGQWNYGYRAVDNEGHTMDVLLNPNRDRDAAEAFVHTAIRTQGLSAKITIDQSGAKTQAIEPDNRDLHTASRIRHATYLNHLMEQDCRAVKRLVRPMFGFTFCWAACGTIAGIEVLHATRKGQWAHTGEGYQTPAEQFYSLAA